MGIQEHDEDEAQLAIIGGDVNDIKSDLDINGDSEESPERVNQFEWMMSTMEEDWIVSFKFYDLEWYLQFEYGSRLSLKLLPSENGAAYPRCACVRFTAS